MNPRQNFYSSVFDQIMNYKKEREFESNKNFLFDPVVGLGLFASVLVVGVFSGYIQFPTNISPKSSQVATGPILKIEERSAADVFSPELSAAAENGSADLSKAVVLVPTEDGYVSADAPQKSHGSEGILKVDKDSQKMSYLKFKVPAGQSFGRVLLRLTPADSNEIGGDLSMVNENLWTERLLTFDSIPTNGEVRLGPIGSVSAGVTKTIDVTNYIKAGNTYTFKLSSNGADGVDYSSREASTETSPALLFL